MDRFISPVPLKNATVILHSSLSGACLARSVFTTTKQLGVVGFFGSCSGEFVDAMARVLQFDEAIIPSSVLTITGTYGAAVSSNHGELFAIAIMCRFIASVP